MLSLLFFTKVDTTVNTSEPSQREEGESDPGPPGVDNPQDEVAREATEATEATEENRSDFASDEKGDDGQYLILNFFLYITHLQRYPFSNIKYKPTYLKLKI